MEIKDILANLIGIDSESKTSNRAMMELICSLLLAVGFRREDTTVIQTDAKGDAKFNIIAKKGQGNDALMLAGHMDTVSSEPRDQWHSDPLQLTKRRSRLYGLGTSDMKLFLAAAIKVAEQYSADELKHPLALVFTCDEEIGLLGAKFLKRNNLLGGIRWGIVGEPTRLCPVRMHKGYLRAELIVRGQAGHASNPTKGINAIEKAYQFITDLLAYRDTLNEFQNGLILPPFPTLNIGAINGGKETNRIPAECTVRFEIRPIPGQNIDDIISDLRAMAAKLGKFANKSIGEIQLMTRPTKPMETSNNSLIVKIAEKVTGKMAIGVPYSTEATIFNSAGIETIILGPGDIAQAHQPNEFVEEEYLPQTVETLTQIVNQICLTERQ